MYRVRLVAVLLASAASLAVGKEQRSLLKYYDCESLEDLLDADAGLEYQGSRAESKSCDCLGLRAKCTISFPETCSNWTCGGDTGYRCADVDASSVEVCRIPTMKQDFKLQGDTALQTRAGLELFFTKGVANHESFYESYLVDPASNVYGGSTIYGNTCEVSFSGNKCDCKLCKQDNPLGMEFPLQLLNPHLAIMPLANVDCSAVEDASFEPLVCADPSGVRIDTKVLLLDASVTRTPPSGSSAMFQPAAVVMVATMVGLAASEVLTGI